MITLIEEAKSRARTARDPAGCLDWNDEALPPEGDAGGCFTAGNPFLCRWAAGAGTLSGEGLCRGDGPCAGKQTPAHCSMGHRSFD